VDVAIGEEVAAQKSHTVRSASTRHSEIEDQRIGVLHEQGRSQMVEGIVEIVARADSLVDDGAGTFATECLLIPGADLPKVAIDDGAFLRINFHPSSPERTLPDPYRKPLAELSRLILEAVSDQGQK
jgi:hypothetical protein